MALPLKTGLLSLILSGNMECVGKKTVKWGLGGGGGGFVVTLTFQNRWSSKHPEQTGRFGPETVFIYFLTCFIQLG